MTSILCYGDSLTAGYYRFGSEFYPYGDTLATLSQAKVNVVGMSGWTSDEMVQNAHEINNEDVVGFCSKGLVKLLASNCYDIVCVMAGTNDLGTNIPAADIIENLRTLLNMCLVSNGINTRVVLLTIPPNGAEHYMGAHRSTVNAALKLLVQAHAKRVTLVDTASVLPISELELWDSDMLHLSPFGSERLGRFVYNQLCSEGFLQGNPVQL